MSLTKYKQKRSFEETPEPTGGKGKGGELIFVIQKHAATRLHYDFRLEMEGVLKSWAVPKGPSTDPTVKRLAMAVEDHPYDYKDFEGIIPKGNYGGGTVIVWDKGTYEPIEKVEGKKAQEKLLLKQLKEGSIKIVLHGKKLKGEYALVKTKGFEENSWLLIKHKDKYASTGDITLKDKSASSGKTLEKVAASSKNIYGQDNKQAVTDNKKNASTKKNIKKQVTPSKTVKKKTAPLINNKIDTGDAPKAPFPESFSPMLATLVDKPFDEPGWLYEIKWDGYRAVALMNKKEVNLLSRNNKSFNEKFYPIYEAVKQWGINAVVDGEIAVMNDAGISNFGALQNWRSEADGTIIYYVFDLLWLEGYDLKNLPLAKRREILAELVPKEGLIRMSENFEASATEFLEAAKKMGLEGIIAKKADSVYHTGERSREWLKMKVKKRHEVVIGGYTNNEGSAKAFSALLVGVFENAKLQYTGKIGTGFSDALQKEMMATFKPLITSKNPFDIVPDVNKPSRFRPNPPHAIATWLKPSLVCEVSYAEITSDGVMRHPSFEGMREDKKAADVGREIAEETNKLLAEEDKPTTPKAQKASEAKEAPQNTEKTTASKAEKLIKPSGKEVRKTLLNPTDESQVRKVNGHELKFSNLGKIYWPKEKYTKRDMINYYYQVAPFILPYLYNRPQSLNRYPNGITGESFYQKDVSGKAPGWIKLFPYHTSDDLSKDKNFMVGTDDSSLLYMANLGCIEMHPWNSTIQNPDNPDWCAIDLDPGEKTTFEQVIQTAQVTKKILDAIDVPAYCKTSGSTGIHIYIPLEAKYTYDECQLFGRWIATQVALELPKFTTIERTVNKRSGKLYVDFLQNRPKATLAAAYSLRPKPGATVSMPLHWEEVKKGLKLKDFNIENAIARAKREGDIFKPVLGKGIDLVKIMERISSLE
jgi:bifunctional non-homologous end joining protein LigD